MNRCYRCLSPLMCTVQYLMHLVCKVDMSSARLMAICPKDLYIFWTDFGDFGLMVTKNIREHEITMITFQHTFMMA